MLTKSNASLVAEYHILEKRYEKLVLEGKEMQKEHDEDLKYYIHSQISDHKWQKNIEYVTSKLAVSSVKMKIGKRTMNQIRKNLKLNY